MYGDNAGGYNVDPIPDADASIFWMVWEPESGYTKKRHPNFNAADAEAKRLARANRGKRYYVLRGVCYAEVNNLRVVTLS